MNMKSCGAIGRRSPALLPVRPQQLQLGKPHSEKRRWRSRALRAREPRQPSRPPRITTSGPDHAARRPAPRFSSNRAVMPASPDSPASSRWRMLRTSHTRRRRAPRTEPLQARLAETSCTSKETTLPAVRSLLLRLSAWSTTAILGFTLVWAGWVNCSGTTGDRPSQDRRCVLLRSVSRSGNLSE